MAEPLELLLKRFSLFENSCFFAIFNSPARPSAEFGLVDLRKLVVFCDSQIAPRPSAEFRVVESLSLRRGAHCDEAARPKPLPSQWGLRQRKLAASFKTIAKPLRLLLKRFLPSTSARLNSALLARLNLLVQTLAMKLSTQELYFQSFFRSNPRSCG